MRALVTGATGFVGTALVKRLVANGSAVVVLGRDAERAKKHFAGLSGVDAHGWDLMREPAPAAAFREVDVVFHLAGENVAARRWNAEQKRKIMDSRRLGTRHLVAALRSLDQRPSVLVASSATGYYGSRGDEILTEHSEPGTDFLADVCIAWEAEAVEAESLGMRVARLRTGMVLGNDGALKKMLPIFKLGLGGRIASGNQWMPWLHIDDLVELYLTVSRDDRYRGPINATTSQPVTNREFTKTLGSILGRPTILPAPYFLLRAALGELAIALVASERVIAERADQFGFPSKYPQLRAALEACVKS